VSSVMNDPDEVKEILGTLAEAEAPGWRKYWLGALAQSRQEIVVDAPEPWVVLQGRRAVAQDLRKAMDAEGGDAATVEDGVELTTDEDDSFFAGRSVTLPEHSCDVERFARTYAAGAGLPAALVEDIALAGWLHDIGKADRRFQIMLRGGSEIDFFKDERPWAKSDMPPGAKAAQRLARQRSGYPRGARHEVQSLAMIEEHLEVIRAKAHDIDLVLHLVGSHHGYCRPFAPAVADDHPVAVALPHLASARFGTMSFSGTSSSNRRFGLELGLADRFWELVQRYGWLELCWLEAILRLGDHRASEWEQAR
jgi:CRISPR-associated endonuclease/helicase Cas3